MAMTKEDFIAALKELSVVELNELVKACEEVAVKVVAVIIVFSKGIQLSV